MITYKPLPVTIENPVQDKKNSKFFYFTKKTLAVNHFKKQYAKVPAKLRFCKK